MHIAKHNYNLKKIWCKRFKTNSDWKIENSHYKACMVPLYSQKGANIKSFFFLEDKTLHGREKMSGKAGFFLAHGATSSYSFVREAWTPKYFIVYSLCLAPWKNIIIIYFFGTTLDFIIVSHYKYALNILSKTICLIFIIFWLVFLYNVWYFHMFMFAMPFAQAIVFPYFETWHICVSIIFTIYTHTWHGMYRINGEMFAFTLQSRQMFIIYLWIDKFA